MRLLKRPTGTALIPIDDVIDNLPFVVHRDHCIVAGFARKQAALEWAEMRSLYDESRFAVHTAQEVVGVIRTARKPSDQPPPGADACQTRPAAPVACTVRSTEGLPEMTPLTSP